MDSANSIPTVSGNLDSRNSETGIGNYLMDAQEYIRHPFRNTLILSGSFIAIYTAFLGILNLQSSLNKRLGVISLAFVYGTIVISSIMAPPIIGKIGPKRTLVIACIAHTIYTVSNLYPTWGTLIPSSILLGAASGPMWTAQGLYIAANGDAYSKIQNEDLYPVLSRFNAIFYTGYHFTEVSGNLLSSFIFMSDKGIHANDSSADTKFCGMNDCPGTEREDEISNPNRTTLYALFGVYVFFDLCGLFLTAVFLPPLDYNADGRVRKKTSFSASFHALSDKRLLMLMPFFMAAATNQAVMFTEYTKAFISCALGIDQVGIIMATHGAVTGISTFTFGRLAKYTGRQALFTAAVLMNMTMMFFLLFWNPVNQHYALFFVVPIGFGISEGILPAQFISLLGITFPKERDTALANFWTATSVSFTIALVMGVFVCLRERFYVVISLNIIGYIGYILVELKIRTQARKSLEDRNAHLRRDSNIMNYEKRYFVTPIEEGQNV